MKKSKFTLACGRRFRTFNIFDDFNREALHIEVDTSITSARLVRIFEQVKRDHGLPQVIRSDNSPEFLGERFVQWLKANGVALRSRHACLPEPDRVPCASEDRLR
jgi:putative transposase